MKDMLRGVFAPITTPFDAQGEVNYEALVSNMKKYANSPIHGYLALGSNGENKSLTNSEKEKVLKIIIENKAENQKVMVGSIFESTKETIEFAKRAEELGADFITILPPSYFKSKMTDKALIKYFTDVASSLSTPVLIYNAPGFSGGTTLSANLIKEVSKHPNIVGVKDSSVGNVDNYLLATDESFAVMSGSINSFFNAVLMGATGGIISLANAFPEITVRLYDYAVNGNVKDGIEFNKKLLRINKAISGKGGVAAVKAAMDFAGFYGGEPRLPLLPMEKEEVKAIKELLVKERLLETL